MTCFLLIKYHLNHTFSVSQTGGNKEDVCYISYHQGISLCLYIDCNSRLKPAPETTDSSETETRRRKSKMKIETRDGGKAERRDSSESSRKKREKSRSVKQGKVLEPKGTKTDSAMNKKPRKRIIESSSSSESNTHVSEGTDSKPIDSGSKSKSNCRIVLKKRTTNETSQSHMDPKKRERSGRDSKNLSHTKSTQMIRLIQAQTQMIALLSPTMKVKAKKKSLLSIPLPRIQTRLNLKEVNLIQMNQIVLKLILTKKETSMK